MLKPWKQWHRPLITNVTLMIGLALVAGVGVLVDQRMLLGESVWIKPMKFGIAFALYSGTLAWLLTRLERARRFGWWLGTLFAVSATIEVAGITVQAARGTFSHFNTDVADPITAAATQALTTGVAALFLMQLGIAAVLLVQRAGDRAFRRAVRAGITLSTLGMIVPIYWMVTELDRRTVVDANGRQITMYQGHGIGDPDGHGMPITHWSTTGGDYRVPHFVGLHGIQALLLVAAVLGALATRVAWLRSEQVRTRLVGVAALGYAGVFATVTWQAGRGQSLIHPDALTVIALAAVVTCTIALAIASVRRTAP
ncbi:hypothetical protein SAMN05421812_104462 [Asanoa hainanensis]|uniref:Uncharacterized protein n=1 Tax=Asanoa hainanensis TaxID=560556 RepID=A0A239LQI5_9ACTN|nr:hypothetical protein [Asanoa hainanensis]SNT31939.1 hypothetical protein SAMN05421812_104462 [Asanoa hainanensis]